MSPLLQFNTLVLDLVPSQASWSLKRSSGEQISGLRAGVVYRLNGRQFRHAPESWEILEKEQTRTHGQIRAAWDVPGEGGQTLLQIQLVFRLSSEPEPLLRWQMQVSNQGIQPLALDTLELMNGGLTGEPWIYPEVQEPSFYANGWQSWSFTGTYQPHETARSTRLGRLSSPMFADSSAPHPKRPGHFTSDMFAVLGCRHSRQGILAGFLSQQQQFGYVECLFDPLSFSTRKKAQNAALAPVLHLHAPCDGVILAPGDVMTSDWACVQFVAVDDVRPLDPYLAAVAALHNLDERGRRRSLPPDLSPPNNGWCSWYHYHQNITAENLRANLETAAAQREELPLELFQIDDGFQTLVGDWFQFRPSFPDGVAPLAKEIRQAGFMPGLWLAPFILQRSSKTAKTHPEWLLKDHHGRPVNAGFVWHNLTFALDITHPEALAYAVKTVRTAVHDWGFDFIKLDFLYAGALAGSHHTPGSTRAQVLRRGLQALREAAGDRTIILGCGCPLGPAIGLMDAMRIGPDVDQHWEPSVGPVLKLSRSLNHAIFSPETIIPSARNALHNILTRMPIHQRWWVNDPDCLLVRDTSKLTLPEVQALATAIFLSGGQFLLSDDLTALTPERLRIAQTMLPLLPCAASAEDWFETSTPQRLRMDLDGPVGTWRLLAFFNWENVATYQELKIGPIEIASAEQGLSVVRDFWTGEIIADDLESNLQTPTRIQIPPHGVRLFAVRQVSPEQPVFLGSDLHMSQGMEISEWHYTSSKIHITFQTAAALSGKAVFYVPESFTQGQPEKLLVFGQDGSPITKFHNGPYLTVQVELNGQEPTQIRIQAQDQTEQRIDQSIK